MDEIAKEALKPALKALKLFMVLICFGAAIASFIQKDYMLGVAWWCCGTWEGYYFSEKEKNRKLKQKLKEFGWWEEDEDA